jgi:hypothetical protein
MIRTTLFSAVVALALAALSGPAAAERADGWERLTEALAQSAPAADARAEPQPIQPERGRSATAEAPAHTAGSGARPRVIWRDGARRFDRNHRDLFEDPALGARLDAARDGLTDAHRFPGTSAARDAAPRPGPGWVWREGWIDPAGRFHGRWPGLGDGGWQRHPGHRVWSRRLPGRCTCDW